MADLEKTVSIIFSGSDSSLSSSIRSVESGLSGLNTSITSATQPLADFASGIAKVDAALAAMAVGGLAYAYAKANEFQSASIDLEKVLGDQKGRIGEAEQAAIDLSNAYGTSATSVLQAAANFKQAGYDFDESMALVKASLDLMIAGETDAHTASEILIGTLKGFQQPASEAARLIDSLNEVSNNYATNVVELGIGMSKLAPIAQTMGLSFEETEGLLTPVIEIFRSGSEAADALKTGLMKLVSERGPVEEALEAIGVAQTDANGAMRSGKDILHDVQVAFQGLSQEEKLYYAGQLAGIEQAARMVVVFDGLSKTTEITATALKAAGSAQEEVNLRLESGEVQVKRFIEGWNNLVIGVGKEFQSAATSAVSGATEIEKALAAAVNSGTFDDIFDAIGSFSTRLGDTLREIAQNMPEALEQVDWTGVMESFNALGDSIQALFKAFFGAIDLTTAEGLAEALQTIVNGFQKLVDVTKGILDSFKPAAEYLGTWARSATDASSETAELVGTITGFGFQLNKVSELLSTFGSALSILAGASMVNAIANIGELATGLAGIAGPIGVVVAAAGALGTAIGAISGPIDVLNEGMAGFEDALEPVASGMKTAAESAGELRYKIGDAGQAIEQFPSVFNLEMGIKKTDDFERAVTYLTTTDPIERVMNVRFNPVMDEYDKAVLNVEAEKAELPVKFIGTIDEEAAKTAMTQIREIVGYREDGTPIYYVTTLKGGAVEGVKKELEEKIPKEKELEIKLKGEIDTRIAEIKANAETLQTAMEWTAKLDIAQAEAAAKELESVLGHTSDVITNMGSTMASMFSKVPDDLSAYMEWLQTMNQEQQIQKESFELYKKVIEQQLKIMRLKTERLQAGDALIHIETSGLEPYLEEIMWAIIQKCHVRATEEASEFLLGI